MGKERELQQRGASSSLVLHRFLSLLLFPLGEGYHALLNAGTVSIWQLSRLLVERRREQAFVICRKTTSPRSLASLSFLLSFLLHFCSASSLAYSQCVNVLLYCVRFWLDMGNSSKHEENKRKRKIKGYPHKNAAQNMAQKCTKWRKKATRKRMIPEIRTEAE